MIRGAVLTTLLMLLPAIAHAQYEATPTPTAEPAATAAMTPAETPAATPVVTPVPPGLVFTGATKLKVGGTFYAFYKYDLTQNAGNVNQFDVSRAYLNIEPSWGDDFYARVTTDLVRETLTQGTSGSAAVNTTGSDVIRLKYAYLGYRVAPNVDLRVGMQHTPFVGWEEDLWGYRVLSVIAAEAYGMSSSDFGWSAIVKGGSFLEVHAGVYNGELYTKPELNKYKDFEGRITLSPLPCGKDPGLRITGFYQYGFKATDLERVRAAGVVSWQDRFVTIGAEYLSAQDGTATGKHITGGGPSVFGVLTLPGVHPPRMKEVRLLARVDVLDPDIHTKNDASTRVIAGVAARSNDKIQFVLDYQQTDPEKSGAKTAQAVFAHWEAKF